ncbi:MAG: acetyl-CoA carboxylase carboxyl transferase subunit beta, partial [Microcoleus sp. CAN_BIN18]|nr:acetyl-CoA carboxylase carboxyl transferase subunit beta [Microcoleus sp. CAN_BIN18]
RDATVINIPIFTHPTPGGVTPCFAMRGDVIIADQKATVAFTGGRVIEQTLREKLPENYQTSEYSFAHGFVDLIVPRTQLKKTLAQLISLHQPQPFLADSEFSVHDASDSHAVPSPTHAFKLSP